MTSIFPHGKQYFTDCSTDGQTAPAPSQFHQHVQWGWLSLQTAEKLGTCYSCSGKHMPIGGTKAGTGPGAPSRPPLRLWCLGVGAGAWGRVLATGAHQHSKGHIRMCGYILFWNCLPLVHSVAATHGALAVCRISLARTEESFVFFVPGSWEANVSAL